MQTLSILGYNRIAVFDCETFQQKNLELRDMCISFAYEGAKVAGVFNKITFVHNGFKHRYANVIKKNFLTFDYLPTYMANK